LGSLHFSGYRRQLSVQEFLINPNQAIVEFVDILAFLHKPAAIPPSARSVVDAGGYLVFGPVSARACLCEREEALRTLPGRSDTALVEEHLPIGMAYSGTAPRKSPTPDAAKK
jgi:hypothetical protein